MKHLPVPWQGADIPELKRILYLQQSCCEFNLSWPESNILEVTILFCPFSQILHFFCPLILLCSLNLEGVVPILYLWLSIQCSFILCMLTSWESLSPMANEKSSFSDQNWQHLPLISGHKLWCLKSSLAAIGHFSKITVASTTRVYGLHSHELLTEYQMWIASCEIIIQ